MMVRALAGWLKGVHPIPCCVQGLIEIPCQSVPRSEFVAIVLKIDVVSLHARQTGGILRWQTVPEHSWAHQARVRLAMALIRGNANSALM